MSPLSSRERSELRRAHGTRLPLVVVIIALGMVIVLPRLADRRIERLRNEINDVADPARLRVAQIQLEIALQGAQRRGFLLAADAELDKQFELSRTRRRQAEQTLIAYAHQLEGTNSVGMVHAAREIEELDRALDSLVTSARPASAEHLKEQRQQFLLIQTAALGLGAAIDSAAASRRRAISDTDRIIQVVTSALVLLGLGAAFLVGRLGRHFRALALRLDEYVEDRERLFESERTARALAEQRQRELERVTDSRARLLRGFTHDVKNPLGVADGHLVLLEEGVVVNLDDRQRLTIGRVRRSIEHALELVSHLLDIARAEAGQLEVRLRKVDVRKEVRDVVDAFAAQADGKRLALTCDLPEDLPAIETDATRLRQVVGNLVSNAIKYTPRGGHVAICGALQTDQSARVHSEMLITVRDDGPGISESTLPLLFMEFARFDAYAAEGSGIGLAISQRIAEALGGRITVESEVGNGSTFVLHLPLSSRDDATSMLDRAHRFPSTGGDGVHSPETRAPSDRS